MKNKKCKLMFFTYILGGGGAERVVLNILNNIDFTKYEIYLTLGQRDGNNYLSLLKNEQYININYLDIPVGSGNEIVSDKLSELLDELHIDLLFTEANYTNTLAYNARKKQKGKKVRLIFGEANFHSIQNGLGLKERMKVFYRHNFVVKKIICESDGVKNDLHKNYKVFNRKLVRIYNPIDIEEIKKTLLKNEKIDITKDKNIRIVNVARLVKQKNLFMLLDAFRMVQEKLQNVSLYFVGDGVLRGELEKYVKDKKIKNVVFVGFVSNPYYYMKNSDIFVLSSNHEGFGNVLVENMVCNGGAIISTDCPSGPNEILEDGKYGVLVPVNNANLLSEAIIDLCENTDKRNKYRSYYKSRAMLFDAKKSAKEYEKVFDSVIKL